MTLKIFTVNKGLLTSLLAALLMLVAFPGAAAQYQHHQLKGQELLISTDDGKVSITALNTGAFEVFYEPYGVKELPSYALASHQSKVKVTLTQTPEHLTLATSQVSVVIDKSPLRLHFYQHGKLLTEEERGLFVHDALRGFRFNLQPDEKLMGGGERVLGMDRRGQRVPLYNKASYGYGAGENKQMYFGMPAVMSSHKYMLVFDNSAKGTLDMGKADPNVLQFSAVGGRTAYLFIAGKSYPALLQHFVDATGKQPLPPRWAFGNIASRFGYRSEQQVMDTVAAYKKADFPLDGIVLDLFWFGDKVKGTMGNLDWYKPAFPTPEKMLSSLHQQGVNTVLITEPFILDTSKRWQQALDNHVLAEDMGGQVRSYPFYFGQTGLIDIFKPAARDWFWKIYQHLARQGVAGWWGDLGEPEVHPEDTLHHLGNGQVATADEIHNVYGHQWAKMLYQRLRAWQPNTRPFIMMRSGFVGSQRYGMIPWTGDVSRSWDGLKPQVELSLQMGLMGMAYTHSDLGGFAGGEKFDREMYIRWLEYGVFQPVFRPHAQDNIAPEPVFHDKLTQDTLRPYVKLRYAMLPYNYTLAYQNSTTGMPLMRPLFFSNENNPALIANDQSYMWGDSFLVTPVTSPGVTSVKVNVPPGRWFDFWTDKAIDGGKTVAVPVDLKTIPVLVKGGSFVPMVKPVNHTKDYHSNNLQLHYYDDVTVHHSSGQMYDDDGHSANALHDGAYELLHFTSARRENSLKITLQRTSPHGYKGMPTTRQMTVIVHHLNTPPKQVRWQGKVIPLVARNVAGKKHQAFYDAGKKQLIVTFDWDHRDASLDIRMKSWQ